MQRIKWTILLGAFVLLLSGCQLFSPLSPEQIVEKALAATEEPQFSYYGEMSMKGIGTVGEELIENVTMKEWHDAKRSRSEISSVDGDIIIVVNEEKVQLYLVDEAVVYETEGEDFEAFSSNPKEQLDNLLMLLRDSHEVEMLGKEKIANRNTHHLKATTRADSKSILGDLELWIDEEYWIPLKTKSKSGEFAMEMEYDVIEFEADLPEHLFVLDLPDHVVIEGLEGPAESIQIEQDEITSVFEQAVYFIEEDNDWEVDSISYMKGEDTFNYTLLEIDYMHKGLPGLSVIVTKSEESDEDLVDEFAHILDGISETVTIRDKEAMVIDSPEIRMISWQEDDLEYSVHVLNPAIEMDDAVTLLNSMIEIN